MANVSPGVYFRELDLSVYIPRLSSTILGIVGTSPKGPINIPTLVTNAAAFTSTFGTPSPSHLATFSALQFLRYGNQLLFVRVNGADSSISQCDTLNGDVESAFVRSASPGPFTFTAASAATDSTTPDGAGFTITGANNKLLVTINDQSAISITLTSGVDIAGSAIAAEIATALTGSGATSTADVNGVVKISTTASGRNQTVVVMTVTNSAYATLGIDVGTYRGTDNNGSLEITTYDRSTGSSVQTDDATLTLTGTLQTIDDVVGQLQTGASAAGLPVVVSNVGSRIQITHSQSGQNFGLKITTDFSTGQSPLGFDNRQMAWGYGLSPASEAFKIFASSVGEWGNKLTVTVAKGPIVETARNSSFRRYIRTFDLFVYEDGELKESFRSLAAAPEDADVSKGVEFFATAINPAYSVRGEKITGSSLITVEDVVSNTGIPPARTFSFSGGDDGLESVSDDNFIGTITGTERTGLELLADPERYDVNLIIVPGVHSGPVVTKLTSICQIRGDCMAIIDPPFDLSVQQVVDWSNGEAGYTDHQPFNTSHLALYYSWLSEYDPVSGQIVWTPPSGWLAGVYAFSDNSAEVWIAPAGIRRGHVLEALGVRHSPDHGEREYMYGNRNAVNPIAAFPNDGITVWGQRTLQRTPTALDRVNVRRLILYVRKALATTLKFFVFEPNDERTWREVVALIEPFLENIKKKRGIHEFDVVCDETINTPERIDNNELHVVILIDPTRAAERINVDIAITRTGAVFEETTRALAGLNT